MKLKCNFDFKFKNPPRVLRPRGKVYILVSYGPPLGTMWGSGFLSHGRELNVGFLAVVGACW